jgi:hypothetical protein
MPERKKQIRMKNRIPPGMRPECSERSTTRTSRDVNLRSGNRACVTNEPCEIDIRWTGPPESISHPRAQENGQSRCPGGDRLFFTGCLSETIRRKARGRGFRQRKTPVLRTGRRNGASTISPGYTDKRFFEIYLKYLKLS